MRIWDIAPKKLCRLHLLGEHRELHAIWSILTEGKKGYANHPEVIRWRGKLRALFGRHERLVLEMKKRGYHHKSPLEKDRLCGRRKQDAYVHTCKEQIEILQNKQCDCNV